MKTTQAYKIIKLAMKRKDFAKAFEVIDKITFEQNYIILNKIYKEKNAK